jgi:hypothetical protein
VTGFTDLVCLFKSGFQFAVRLWELPYLNQHFCFVSSFPCGFNVLFIFLHIPSCGYTYICN